MRGRSGVGARTVAFLVVAALAGVLLQLGAASAQASGLAISGVQPPEGAPGGGYTVVIEGEGFEAGAEVTFGGTPSPEPPIVYSPNEITVSVPAHAAGPVNVAVSELAGKVEDPGAFTYTAPEPIVESVLPHEGSVEGGTPATIYGQNFEAGATVEFGGEHATDVSVLNSTEISVRTPPHEAGSVAVIVEESAGSSPGKNDYFKYIDEPRVTITTPVNGSVSTSALQTVSGEASTSEQAVPEVTVTLYSGSGGSLTFLQRSAAGVSPSGHWSTGFGPLSPGTYTVVAEQEAAYGGSTGSDDVTFTIEAPRAAADTPPTASFTWLPSSPQAGESVELISNSTDAESPISAFAWTLPGGTSAPNTGPLLTAVFSAPGSYPVTLKVTSADGLSNSVTKDVVVSSSQPTLMQPFPVVRIVGAYGPYGVRLSLLTVQAPAGARITVHCNGRGCPVKLAKHTVPANRATPAVVAFRQFERRLPVGVTLVVRVVKADEIGKYTRLVVRRGKLPRRVDRCVGPTGGKPIACPQ